MVRQAEWISGFELTEEERAQMFGIERLVFFYFPRICNHCLNPSCVASCPSGAGFKRAAPRLGAVAGDHRVAQISIAHQAPHGVDEIVAARVDVEMIRVAGGRIEGEGP